MKFLITSLAVVLILSISAQAISFERNPFEIHEVNILEEGLRLNILK